MAAVTEDTNRNNNQNGDVSTLAANIMPTSTNLSSDSIEDLTHEVEMLKKKLEEERAKFNDVECKFKSSYSIII